MNLKLTFVRINCFKGVLRNVSYNHKKINEEIKKAVGPSFTFWQRLKMGGIGSPRLEIVSSSPNVATELNKDNYPNKAYIELRPKGICIYFRSLLETFSLTIPYYRLTIYNNSGRFKVYGGSSWIEFAQSKKAKTYFDKLIAKRLEYLTQFSALANLRSE